MSAATEYNLQNLDLIGSNRRFTAVPEDVNEGCVPGTCHPDDLDRVRTEKKPRQEAVDLTIIDAIPIGISVVAPDGSTLYVNRLALDRGGVALDELKDKGFLRRICRATRRRAGCRTPCPDPWDRARPRHTPGYSPGASRGT